MSTQRNPHYERPIDRIARILRASSPADAAKPAPYQGRPPLAPEESDHQRAHRLLAAVAADLQHISVRRNFGVGQG